MSTSTFNRRNFLKGAGMTALVGAAPAISIADDDDGQGLFQSDAYDFDTVYSRVGTNTARWDGPPRRYPGGEFKYGMGVATTDFEVAPCITDALAERSKHRTWGYMSSMDSLVEAIVNWNGERNGLELDPKGIQITGALLPGMIAALNAVSPTGTKVVHLSPDYSGFYGITKFTRTLIDDSEMVYRNGRYEIDWDDLEARLADPETYSMIVCNPHNPVGNVWTEEELLRIGRLCLENDVVVLSDEIHSDFVRSGHEYIPFSRLPDKDVIENSISFNSLSKTFNLAGMKNAYFHSPNRKLFKRVQRNHYPTINTLGCVAHEAAYRDGADWLDQLLVYLDDNHRFVEKYVAENMPSIVCNRAEGTFLSWLDCSKVMDAVGAAENAAEKEVTPEVWFRDWLVKNSGAYLNAGSVYGKGSPGYMRFNLGSSRKVIKAALGAMAQTVNAV